MSQNLYQFSGTEFARIDWCDPARQTTLVADSFRLEDGEVVALERHLRRFSDSVAATTDVSAETLEAFLAHLGQMLPSVGSWFPRIEAVETPGGATLRYRERLAPAWNSEVVVARAPSDPRRFPQVKGPDLEALMALRTAVAPLGAGEAIITTDQDYLVEGAYSSLMVWLPGAAHPTVIPSATAHLPGVTEAVLTDIALDTGVPVNEADVRVDDLEGAELWIVSALQGIRIATAFCDGPALVSHPHRRDQWQDLWRKKSRSVREVL